MRVNRNYSENVNTKNVIIDPKNSLGTIKTRLKRLKLAWNEEGGGPVTRQDESRPREFVLSYQFSRQGYPLVRFPTRFRNKYIDRHIDTVRKLVLFTLIYYPRGFRLCLSIWTISRRSRVENIESLLSRSTCRENDRIKFVEKWFFN